MQWPPLLSPVLLVACVLNALRCLYLVFEISNPEVWTLFPGVEDQSQTFNRGHCVTYSCMSDALGGRGGDIFFYAFSLFLERFRYNSARKLSGIPG